MDTSTTIHNHRVPADSHLMHGDQQIQLLFGWKQRSILILIFGMSLGSRVGYYQGGAADVVCIWSFYTIHSRPDSTNLVGLTASIGFLHLCNIMNKFWPP